MSLKKFALFPVAGETGFEFRGHAFLERFLLLGALHGANTLPGVMRDRVLSCDTQCGRPRPAWLHTTQVEKLVSGLLLGE